MKKSKKPNSKTLKTKAPKTKKKVSKVKKPTTKSNKASSFKNIKKKVVAKVNQNPGVSKVVAAAAAVGIGLAVKHFLSSDEKPKS